MFAMTYFNYYAGLKMESSQTPKSKKDWLIISLVFNLGVLGFLSILIFY
jgi:hypothetical protein